MVSIPKYKYLCLLSKYYAGLPLVQYSLCIWNSAQYILWEYFNNPALLCSNMTPIHFKNKYSCSFSIDFITFNTIDIYIDHNWHIRDLKSEINSWFRLFKSNLIWFENIRGYFGKRKILTIFEHDLIYYHSFPIFYLFPFI